MDAKDAKKKRRKFQTSNFLSVRNIFAMHQLMVTFSDSFIYNAYNI